MVAMIVPLSHPSLLDLLTTETSQKDAGAL